MNKAFFDNRKQMMNFFIHFYIKLNNCRNNMCNLILDEDCVKPTYVYITTTNQAIGYPFLNNENRNFTLPLLYTRQKS